jgi:predicted transcriptional regulator with HTH domain
MHIASSVRSSPSSTSGALSSMASGFRRIDSLVSTSVLSSASWKSRKTVSIRNAGG